MCNLPYGNAALWMTSLSTVFENQWQLIKTHSVGMNGRTGPGGVGGVDVKWRENILKNTLKSCVCLMHSWDVHITVGVMMYTYKLCWIVSKQYDVLTNFALDWCLLRVIYYQGIGCGNKFFKLQSSGRMHTLILKPSEAKKLNQTKAMVIGNSFEAAAVENHPLQCCPNPIAFTWVSRLNTANTITQ